MILIGMPCGNTISSKTAFALFQLAGPDVRLQMKMSIDVADNRNVLCQYALDKGFSHIFMVDADVTFNGDVIHKMLARNKDILGLAYNHRRLPLESVVSPLNEEDKNKPIPTDLFEANWVGTGGMLIKTNVLEKVPKPWFEFTYEPERVSEDVNFCRRARKAGYSIFVDPTIPVRHIGEYLF